LKQTSKLNRYRGLQEAKENSFYTLLFALPTLVIGLYQLKNSTLIGGFITVLSASVCYYSLRKLITIKRRIKELFVDESKKKEGKEL